jgi:hypothetical protein
MLLPLSSAMDTGGSGGPLATGTPSTVVVDLGEAPSVVSLARQASVGLSDSGSEGKGSSSVFFLADNKRSLGEGCLYMENTRHVTQGLHGRFGCDLALSRKDSWLDLERG